MADERETIESQIAALNQRLLELEISDESDESHESASCDSKKRIKLSSLSSKICMLF